MSERKVNFRFEFLEGIQNPETLDRLYYVGLNIKHKKAREDYEKYIPKDMADIIAKAIYQEYKDRIAPSNSTFQLIPFSQIESLKAVMDDSLHEEILGKMKAKPKTLLYEVKP